MEGLRTKRILVTGGSGFIGNALCARLADIGAEAHAISRSGITPHSRATRTWSADLADRDALHRVFAEVRPHVVFHLAGYVYGSRALEHVQPAVSGNFTTTVNVL